MIVFIYTKGIAPDINDRDYSIKNNNERLGKVSNEEKINMDDKYDNFCSIKEKVSG